MNPKPTTSARNRAATDERGMALVLALLILMVLSVIGAALMANVNIETKMSGHKVRDTQALAIAEAGVQEAILRIRNGDVPDDNNVKGVTLIYNQVAGSIPVSGVDTTSVPTIQPAGQYLNYTSATKNGSVLSVRHKTRNGQILKYDENAATKINPTTGQKIYIISSTGRSGTATRQIYAEVTRSTINSLARAAVAAKVGIEFGGNIAVCGHDHRMDTNPEGIGPPACDAFLSPGVHTSCLPGAWSSSVVTQQGASNLVGEPTPKRQNQPGFYQGPWEVLGMTQSEWWSWVGTPTNTVPANPVGIIHMDNDGLKQNAAGDYHFSGGDGEGLLYIDGDVSINGNFTYKGLLYIEGNLDINGDSWILGGLIVKGKQSVKISNGSAVILYSAEAISQKIAKYGGDLKTIAWREVTPP